MPTRNTSEKSKGSTLRIVGLAKRVDHAKTRSQRRKTLRAPRIAAPSPLTHCRTRARASAAPNDAHTGKKKQSPPRRNLPATPRMTAVKLITALALLALHGAAGDDLCAPASTSAARRARRAARVPPSHVGLRRPRRRPRPRRRRPRRPCRAGAPPAFLNSTSPSKTPLQALEQVWSRQRCASAALRPTSGPDNATALGRGPCDARLARGLPRRANQHMAAHEQQA